MGGKLILMYHLSWVVLLKTVKGTEKLDISNCPGMLTLLYHLQNIYRK